MPDIILSFLVSATRILPTLEQLVNRTRTAPSNYHNALMSPFFGANEKRTRFAIRRMARN